MTWLKLFLHPALSTQVDAFTTGTEPNPTTTPSEVVVINTVETRQHSIMFQSIMKMLTPASAPSSCQKKVVITTNTQGGKQITTTMQDAAFDDGCVWDSLLKELDVQSLDAGWCDISRNWPPPKRSGSHLAVWQGEIAFVSFNVMNTSEMCIRGCVGKRSFNGSYIIKKQSVLIAYSGRVLLPVGRRRFDGCYVINNRTMTNKCKK